MLMFYSGGFVVWHNEVLMLATAGDPQLWPRDMVMMTRPADAALLEQLRGRRVCLISGPLEGVDVVIPDAQVIEQTTIGADGKYFAICTWLQL